jgi:hypothetical protein
MVPAGTRNRFGGEDKMSAKRSASTVLKDIGLFLASPVIALAYLALFPFIGLVMLVKMARKPDPKQTTSP